METISKRLNKLHVLPNELSVCPPITEKTQINIDISTYCNQKCIYCLGNHIGEHDHNHFINESLFYRVAREAFELGVREIGVYASGDPLTNPKIYDYIAFLKELGYTYIFTSTNGLLCTPDNMKKLASAGLDSIKFSISAASEKQFTAHHGVSGFEKVYDNIKFAWEYRKANGLKYKIYIFSIITKQNMHEVENMRNAFKPYCDEFLTSKMLNPFNAYIGCERLFDEQPADDISISVINKLPCSMLFSRVNINAEGHLCICCHQYTGPGAIAVSVADLNNTSLKDAYYCDAFKVIREKHISGNIQNTICNRCINGTQETMYSIRSACTGEPFSLDSIDISAVVDKAFPKNHRTE